MIPTSIIIRLVRPVCVVACLAAALGGTIPAWPQQAPLAEAFLQRDAEFRAIKDGVATAQEKLGALEQAVSALAAALDVRRDLTSAERLEVTEQLYQASTGLQRHAALQRFRSYADRVSQATDAAYEIELLNRSLRGADLGAPLRGLIAIAGRLGVDNVALSRSAEAYGELTAGLLDATGRLIDALNDMRLGARLGSERYGGAHDPRYRQLADEWGQNLADAATYAPTSPWEVFRPIARPSDRSLDVALIWDEQEQDWYRIDGSVPVETIFRDAFVALDRRPTPGKLKYLAENFSQLKGQEEAAEAFAGYLAEAGRDGNAPSNRAFSRLPDRVQLLANLRDPAIFQAKFAYDTAFRARTFELLDKLREDLIEQGPPAEQTLRDFDRLLTRYDVTLESQWARSFLPATGDIRVVAWFSDNPKSKFTSMWRFEREKVTIDVNNGDARNNGHAHGIRIDNVVRSDRSIPSRNCIASDERVFQKGGTLTFSSLYVCTLPDGTTQTNKVAGAGTWQIVAPAGGSPRKSMR
jgi:hypothetical protein